MWRKIFTQKKETFSKSGDFFQKNKNIATEDSIFILAKFGNSKKKKKKLCSQYWHSPFSY
jgi:hypothetical protein